jgi:hypothetical protein
VLLWEAMSRQGQTPDQERRAKRPSHSVSRNTELQEMGILFLRLSCTLNVE